LLRFVEEDDNRTLRRDLVNRLRRILTALLSAEGMNELDGPPGWRLHQLTGDRAGTWSISVSGNWRVTFRRNIRSRFGGLPPMSEEITTIGMRLAHPGEFIRGEILNELGLSITRAAEVLGVRRATLSDVVNGRAALSPEMALRIEKAFGVSLDLLLRMQALFDSYMVRRRADELDVKPFDSAATVTAGGEK
jgi:antitoxin HigA-1